MTALSTIRSFCESRVAAWAASQLPIVKVAYEDVPFTTPNTPYLRVLVNHVITKNNTVDTLRKTHYGFYQIDVCVQEGKGSKAAEILAQSVVDLFPVLPKGVVSIEQTPTVNPAFRDGDGFRITPIRILYRYETT